MGQSIHATFRSTSWEETPITEPDSLPRLTRASCQQVYTGDVVGDSTLEYLMVYSEGGTASFVGVERVVGSVDGRAGSFAMRHEGVFEDGIAKMTLSIVSGAGTGALRTLRGTARFESPHAAEYPVTFDCSFDG